MLLFKKRFIEAINRGEKTQTIRLWKHRRLRAGQRSYIPGAGYIRVDAVEATRLEELTEDDARLDGFDSLADMLREIHTLYDARAIAERTCFRVRFHLLPGETKRGETRRGETNAES